LSSKDFLMSFRQYEEEWSGTVLKKDLEDNGERKKEFKTASGIPVKRVYTPLDLPDQESDIGLPGSYPYVRGISPTMYRGRLWERVQYSGYGLPEDTNKRIMYLLEQGQTGFYIALDLPSQMCYDCDHPLANGEVGKVGVSINSLRDMEILLDGIPLEKVSQIRITAMSTGPLMGAFFLAVAEQKGISPDKISVKIQNDVIKEFVCRGTYIFPPDRSVKFACDLVEYCSNYLPNWSPLCVASGHFRSSGASAVQELAIWIANSITYIEEVVRRGKNVDDFVPQMQSLISAATPDICEEVAKIRAARKIWAIVLNERFGAKKPESQMLSLNSFTSGTFLTAQEPLNNIIRIAIQALSIGLAGSQDVSICAYDEPLCTPSQEAATLALRTSQIVAYESGVTNVVDPLGGSYYIEALTDKFVNLAFAELKKIEDLGGVVACIENGYLKQELTKSAYNYQKEIESGERVLIGVNKFKTSQAEKIKPFVIKSEIEGIQKKRLAELKRERDQEKVQKALKALQDSARADENTMPALIEAVKTYATVGEIGDALRAVWGEWKQVGISL